MRGYAFLLIFCAHYLLPYQLAYRGTLKYSFYSALSSLEVFSVPGFFVLSGYLIGGILYDTRNRDGFFRIFYGRRVLRIFPVYYVTLLSVWVFFKVHGVTPTYRFWMHYFFIQNLLPGYTLFKDGPVAMLHLWTLAVEEQFYLLWPLVVWLFPEKKKLVRIGIGLFLTSFVMRAAAPLFMKHAESYTYFTPTCVGPVLLGVLLSLARGEEMYKTLEQIAKWVTLCGVGAAVALGAWKGYDWSYSTWGEEAVVPLTCITGVALILAIQQQHSLLERVFSSRWVCWIGRHSYSAFVVHYLFAPFFFHVVSVRLSMHMRPHFAVLMAALAAFCLTMLLAVFSGLCVEGPAMKLRRNLQYGAERLLKPEIPEKLVPEIAN